MTATARKATVPVQALRQATLTEEQARELYKQGEEAVVFASQDIFSMEHFGPVIQVKGTMLAGRDV